MGYEGIKEGAQRMDQQERFLYEVQGIDGCFACVYHRHAGQLEVVSESNVAVILRKKHASTYRYTSDQVFYFGRSSRPSSPSSGVRSKWSCFWRRQRL